MEQKVNTPRTITNIESARSLIHDVRLVENHLKNGGTSIIEWTAE